MAILDSLGAALGTGILQSLAIEALRGVWGEIDERIAADRAYRLAHPCATATYHRVMASTLPRWRWAARLWHKGQARRWRAWCTAHERDQCDEAAKTAVSMVRSELKRRRV